MAEQKTGIPGDDPAHYGIMGDAMMTLAEWTALTGAYYASKTPQVQTTKPADNTLLYLGGAALALGFVAGHLGGIVNHVHAFSFRGEMSCVTRVIGGWKMGLRGFSGST